MFVLNGHSLFPIQQEGKSNSTPSIPDVEEEFDPKTMETGKSIEF